MVGRCAGSRIAAITWSGSGEFQALPRLSPEAGKAMAHVSRFISACVTADGCDGTATKAG